MKDLKDFCLLFFAIPALVVAVCGILFVATHVPWLAVVPWLTGWAVICALVVWATPREGA